MRCNNNAVFCDITAHQNEENMKCDTCPETLVSPINFFKLNHLYLKNCLTNYSEMLRDAVYTLRSLMSRFQSN